jgi:integrase
MEIGENRPQHRYARDLFLFACYTGVPYGDAVTITRENLVRDKNGDLWLKYKRVKNQMQAAVKLLPEALELIEKYNDDNRETLFPHMECRALMEHMRGIGIRLGIKGLRYHMGRHSFSTLITLEEGVPIETISRMLGHTNIETTQVYAKVTPQKLFDDIDKFIEANQRFETYSPPLGRRGRGGGEEYGHNLFV